MERGCGKLRNTNDAVLLLLYTWHLECLTVTTHLSHHDHKSNVSTSLLFILWTGTNWQCTALPDNVCIVGLWGTSLAGDQGKMIPVFSFSLTLVWGLWNWMYHRSSLEGSVQDQQILLCPYNVERLKKSWVLYTESLQHTEASEQSWWMAIQQFRWWIEREKERKQKLETSMIKIISLYKVKQSLEAILIMWCHGNTHHNRLTHVNV